MAFSVPGAGNAQPVLLADFTTPLQPWTRVLATTPAPSDNALVVVLSPNSAPQTVAPSGGTMPVALSAPVAIDQSAGPLQVVTAQAPLPATYSVSGTIALAASPTDVVTVYGSDSKTVRITAIGLQATATVAVGMQISLLKRSGANSGGTSVALTAAAHDSASAAATATGRAYSSNPSSLGAQAGTFRTDKYTALTLGSSGLQLYTETFGDRPAQAITLRGSNEGFALSLNGLAVVGGSLSFWIEFTEN